MTIDELLVDFDEMGFAPTTLCENPDEYACEWKRQLVAEIERLRLERDVLIGKKIVEKQKYDNALMVKIDIQKQLKDRIAELEKKIENGTLVELPCKVGDTVYSNERIMFEPLTVKVITIHQSIKFPVSYTVIAMAKNGRGIYLSRDNFNEDWFLTKAEAEAKLKELQERNQ